MLIALATAASGRNPKEASGLHILADFVATLVLAVMAPVKPADRAAGTQIPAEPAVASERAAKEETVGAR